MDRAYITTALAMKELNCEKIDTIYDRILLQKKIYLSQIFGLQLGYGYGWYIHGPYSPDLTSAAYQIVPEGFDGVSNWSFKDEYAQKIKRVNNLSNKRPTSLSLTSWYELLASVVYWNENGYEDKETNIEKVLVVKPQFSKEEIELAHEALSEDGYLKSV